VQGWADLENRQSDRPAHTVPENEATQALVICLATNIRTVLLSSLRRRISLSRHALVDPNIGPASAIGPILGSEQFPIRTAAERTLKFHRHKQNYAHGLGKTIGRSIARWSCISRQPHFFPNAIEFRSRSALLSGGFGDARSVGEAQTQENDQVA
jgi:hypothetical protein